MDEAIGIEPQYQVFYIESMLSITSSAVASAELLASTFDPETNLDKLRQEDILDWIQNIFTQAAALSRYFWTPKKDSIHKKRSQFLRMALGISEQSPIKNRRLRNMIEHFDEHLDHFVNQAVVGCIIPNYVGTDIEFGGATFHVFRAFYTRTGVFEVLGEKFELQPVIDEIYEIHRTLLSLADSGYVFRKNKTTTT